VVDVCTCARFVITSETRILFSPDYVELLVLEAGVSSTPAFWPGVCIRLGIRTSPF
jgi:hypothetical protein